MFTSYSYNDLFQDSFGNLGHMIQYLVWEKLAKIEKIQFRAVIKIQKSEIFRLVDSYPLC